MVQKKGFNMKGDFQQPFQHCDSEEEDVCSVFDAENNNFVMELDEEDQTMPRPA